MSEPNTTSPRCPNCGTGGPSRGRSFCDVCGDFVDWGEVAARQAPPPPAPTPQVPATPAPQASDAPPARTETGANPPAPPQHSAAAAAQPAISARQQSRARELLVPLPADEVDPVLPGRPEPPRPDVRPVVATEESGITCWNCGVGNRSDRRFCRNCSVDLRAVPTPAPAPAPSWWSRWLAWLRRRWVIVLSALALAALVVLSALLLPGLLGDDEVVPPAQVAATQEDPEHPPASAVDDRLDSWWGTGRHQNPTGVSLTSTFARPFDLRSTRIVPGVSDNDHDREEEYRPQQIDITVEDSHGREHTFSARLHDGGAQSVLTQVDDAMRVTITVRSAYVSGRGNQVAISDIRFQGRRS
jgi:hypothetical protein